MARSAPDPQPPRILPLDLPDSFDPARGIPARSDLSGVAVEAMSGDLASEHAHVVESRVDGVTAARWSLTGTALTDVVLTDVSATSLVATDGRWRQVEWTGGRVAALEAVRCQWDGVHVRGVRFDYVNFASARLTDVLFTDCLFSTLDLPQAAGSRVAFANCRADEVDTRGLSSSHLDLRGLDVSAFTDVTGLRGATLSEEQTAFHGPALARALGISVR
jgi:uncharacterized protein YjbI with pentapeptide repeats